MAKLFVSYSRKDSVVARKLIDALKSIEQDVWVDWEDIPPAVDWLEQILRGIEASDAFLFLISPDSIASEVCNVEVKHAALNNRRIIPIVVREVDTKAASEIIRKLNWTFLREGDHFEEGLAKIKVAIELDLPWVEAHNWLQARALDWHRKKEPSLLLRGRDLRNARNMIAAATSKDPTPTELQKTYIQHSTRNERNRIVLGIATGIAVFALTILAWTARQASIEAQDQRGTAVANEAIAKTEQSRAEDEERIALTARADAEAQSTIAAEQRDIAADQRKIAEAQRSAARAQIFQARPGGLFISTLLAIDSWQKMPPDQAGEAEEILRKNISLLPRPVAQASQSGVIHSAEFSPNGDTVVTASADGTACVWNVKDGERLFCAEGSGSVNDAVFSPNGEFIVIGDEAGLVQILDAKDGSVQNEYLLNVPIRKVNIRPPNGELLAVALDDGKITIINRASGSQYNLQTTGSINISAFSPDGVWLATGSDTGAISHWNLDSGENISRPEGHRGEVLALAFSPDGRLIVTGGTDKTAIIADVDTGEKFLQVTNEDWVEDVAFGPDGSWFVTASDDQRVRVWSVTSGRESLRMFQDSLVTDVTVSSDGLWIASTGADETVRVWSATTGAEVFRIPLQGSGSVLAFHANSNYLLSGDSSGAIGIWDISVMPAPNTYKQFNDGFAGNVTYSPSGEWVAASDRNRVWLLDRGAISSSTRSPGSEPVLTFRANVKDLTFSPDSEWLGVLTEGNQVATYRIVDRSVKTIPVTSTIQAIAFSPDSLQIITGDTDGTVKSWDGNTTEFIDTVLEEPSQILSLATTEQLLAVGLADKTIVYDMQSEETFSEIDSLGENTLLVFNADGSLLASRNASDQIKLWNPQSTGADPVSLSIPEQIFSLALNPSGTLLAVGTASNVYLIDTSTAEVITRIPHADNVNGLAFSMDGNTLATASSKVVQFWDATKLRQQRIEENKLISTACSRIPQNFSDEQWSEQIELCENARAR